MNPRGCAASQVPCVRFGPLACSQPCCLRGVAPNSSRFPPPLVGLMRRKQGPQLHGFRDETTVRGPLVSSSDFTTLSVPQQTPARRCCVRCRRRHRRPIRCTTSHRASGIVQFKQAGEPRQVESWPERHDHTNRRAEGGRDGRGRDARMGGGSERARQRGRERGRVRGRRECRRVNNWVRIVRAAKSAATQVRQGK